MRPPLPEDNPCLVVIYVTLFNVPIRLKVFAADEPHELAHAFVMSCSCDPARPEVNFLQREPPRLQQLILALAHMIHYQKAAALQTLKQQNAEA